MTPILNWSRAHKVVVGAIALVIVALIALLFISEDEVASEPTASDSDQCEALPAERTLSFAEGTNAIDRVPATTGARKGVTITGKAYGTPIEDDTLAEVRDDDLVAALLNKNDYMAVALTVEKGGKVAKVVLAAPVEEDEYGLILATEPALEYFTWGDPALPDSPADKFRDAVEDSEAAKSALGCLG